jgi:hypothetical protein
MRLTMNKVLVALILTAAGLMIYDYIKLGSLMNYVFWGVK